MKILTANTANDINDWPCAFSVFTGKSCEGKFCAQCKSTKDVKK